MIDTGYYKGKITTNIKKVTRTANKGKANQRGHEETAYIAAKAKQKEKIDSGYKSFIYYKDVYGFENPQNLLDAVLKGEIWHDTDVLGFPLPMLAKKITDVTINPKDQYHHQPKLNGVRCLAYIVKQGLFEKVILRSRGGEEYHIPHIQDQLLNIMNSHEILDGEIYIHGKPLQEISGLARLKRNTESKLKLEYHVYDLVRLDKLNRVIEHPFHLRNEILSQWYNMNKYSLPNIRLVETRMFVSKGVLKQEVDLLHRLAVESGYEGLIVRKSEGSRYEPAFRSDYLLKVKQFHDGEYKVIDIVKSQDALPRECVVLCITKDGKEFKVNPKMTHEEREFMWNNKKQFIGKYYQIKFFEFTEDNIPFHAVGIHFRPKGE